MIHEDGGEKEPQILDRFPKVDFCTMDRPIFFSRAMFVVFCQMIFFSTLKQNVKPYTPEITNMKLEDPHFQ